jgi:hypothetical protein
MVIIIVVIIVVVIVFVVVVVAVVAAVIIFCCSFKVNLSICLSKHQVVKEFGGMEVQLHAYSTLVLNGGRW